MRADDNLIIQVLSLADGWDIHEVVGLVAMYRSIANEGMGLAEFERELRAYIARKRLLRLGQGCLVSDCGKYA